MFGKLAADALGLSDIGSIITPDNYDKVDSDDYVMHEDQEKIFFLIKSKTDEYCFTNKALIHLDGTSAVSKKRMLHRYSYSSHPISHVLLETAGTIDMDVEIKFHMGDEKFSIDVHKKHIEELKDLYKTLLRISEMMRENEIMLNYAKASVDIASTTLGRGQVGGVPVVDAFKELNQAAFSWLTAAHQKYIVKDFGFVFERYIKH
ncbi:PH domain-containing protein [Parachitinimonas caeni]|uniref:PH domain-containing protein n=1 Tax=Parachitinimonas caeni TaxID=3031301 RepID=A0ABT7E4T4_9NEIS|nr:PH domain-containing protein [Parachitinimonas caeni]MDK2126460.1 PH domain-containing protein [Parachitinimonas caeni]